MCQPSPTTMLTQQICTNAPYDQCASGAHLCFVSSRSMSSGDSSCFGSFSFSGSFAFSSYSERNSSVRHQLRGSSTLNNTTSESGGVPTIGCNCPTGTQIPSNTDEISDKFQLSLPATPMSPLVMTNAVMMAVAHAQYL